MRIPPSVVLQLHVAPSAEGGGGGFVHITLELHASDGMREISYPARIDGTALLRLDSNETAYGRVLSDAVFGHAPAREMLAEAFSLAGRNNAPVRLLLFTSPEAPFLGQVRWERMLDPAGETPLALLRRVYITRFCNCDRLLVTDTQTEQLSTALVAVAAPDGLDERFAPIDRAAHEAMALRALRPLVSRVLPAETSVRTLRAELETPADVVVIVCHGSTGRRGSRLWLDGDAGAGPDDVGADRLVSAFGETRLPRMVILGSCFSGTPGTDPAPALAPALVAAGIPCVLAIHAALTPQMLNVLIEAFLAELMRTEHVEEALRIARHRLKAEKMDWASPVLYSRTLAERVGRVAPPLRLTKRFDRLPLLHQALRDGRCLPVLGWDADPEVHPTREELAARLASWHGLPGPPERWTRFSEVARYVVARQGRAVLLGNCQRLLRERADGARAALRRSPGREPDPSDGPMSYWPGGLIHTLARLPLPVYVTTSWFDGLTDALKAAGRKPRVMWPGMPAAPASRAPEAERDPATDGQPLVFHLNGHWSDIESLVATDDEYLARAMAIGEDADLVAAAVQKSLSEGVLLVCGSDVDDLDLRLVLSLHQRFSAGSKRRRHVTVQLERLRADGTSETALEQLLQDYFEESAMSIFWGTPLRLAHDLTEYAP